MQTTKPGWPVSMAVVAAPLALGVVVLQIYGPVGELLTDDQLKSLHEMQPTVGGSLTYVSVTLLHYTVCVCALFYFVRLVADVPVALRRRYLLTAFVLAVVVLFYLFGPLCFREFVPLWFSENAGRVHELLYYNFEKVYERTGQCDTTTQDQCQIFPTLYPAIFWPTFFGVVAAAAGAAAANVQGRLVADAGDGKDDSFYATRRRSLKYSSLLLGAVLTTSTVSSAVFLHLPQRIFDNDQQRGFCKPQDWALEKLQNYGDELTLFLGTIYTLTVLAAIAWPFWRLQRSGTPSSNGAQAPLPFGESLAFTLQVMAVLTPLISALLSNWVQ